MNHNQHIAHALAFVFKNEWADLTAHHQALIVRDVTDNEVDDLADYRRSIGVGNLERYADCLAVPDPWHRGGKLT